MLCAGAWYYLISLFIHTSFHARNSVYKFRNQKKSFYLYISFLLTNVYQVSTMPCTLGNVAKRVDNMDPALIYIPY